MFTKITSTQKKVQDHIDRHRMKYAFAAGSASTAFVLFKFDRSRVASWNTFLEEKGLTDEFYNSEV
jgi:hypothetical protein